MMSGPSETTAPTNHDSFGLASPPPVTNPAVSQDQQQLHMSFTPESAPGFRQMTPYPTLPDGSVVITHTGNSNSGRRRGRPRKYGPDGNINVVGMPQQPQQQPIAVQQQPQQQQPQQQSFSAAAAPPPPVAVQTEVNPPVDGSASPSKKSRGRPRGSKNKTKRQEAFASGSGGSGSNGIAFTPHIINVETGEDVASKIMNMCQNVSRAVCVLSANGAISTVTLRQPATSGGTATYEGRFDILSLSGLFMLTEVSGQKSRRGGLSVALAGPDGSVLGGSVAGLLIAASPSQIIVGSFLHDGQREDHSLIPGRANAGGAAGPSSSPSRGTLSESSGGPASPLNMSSGGFNNLSQGMAGLPWK